MAMDFRLRRMYARVLAASKQIGQCVERMMMMVASERLSISRCDREYANINIVIASLWENEISLHLDKLRNISQLFHHNAIMLSSSCTVT